MYTIYIIHSEPLNKFYTGICQDLQARLIAHKSKKYGSSSFTSKASDWELFLYFQVEHLDHAVRVERKIKSMKSSVYIRNLKKYYELRQKLIDLTNNT